jgi:23S rRNA pseudouridine1911/1915/1917 synthase
MKHSFQVQEKSSGQRLDLFLHSRIRDRSRSNISKYVKSGGVRINKETVKKVSYNVKAGDKIVVEIEELPKVERKFSSYRMSIDIVYQDANLVVVNKPAGITVHPGVGNWDKTLIHGLAYQFRRLDKVGQPPKFGLIHRIDKDTSGLIMVALSDKALWYFSRQFEKREVYKLYIAVVKGDISGLFMGEKKLIVSNYIARHPKARKKMAIVEKERGKLATTAFFYLDFTKHKTLGKISLILASPKTGRTHQIRVQLAHLGYPILGDKVYGKLKYRRMLLHAYKIRCKMLDQKVKEFEAGIPEDFGELFDVGKIPAKMDQVIRDT